MTQDFRFAGTFEDELEKLGRRLQAQGFEQRVIDLQRAHAAEPPRRKRNRSLWRKLRTFLHCFIHLPRLTRHVEELRLEIDQFKAATIEATRFELDAYAIQDAKRVDLIVSLQQDVIAQLAHLRQNLQAVESSFTNEVQRFDALLTAEEAKRFALDDQIRAERSIRQRAFTHFDRRLDLLTARRATLAQAPVQVTGEALPSTGTRALLEGFYYLLEARYRGTRDEIKDRLSIYRPDLRAARQRTGAVGTSIDIGCGRGELLEVMGEEGLEVLGLDCNDAQLDQARQHGLPVETAEALTYLRRMPEHSAVVISAIHVIEHLAFADFLSLVEEIARVLMPGGLVILETPNPRNLIVGACTFHLDPTHIRPIPFEVTEVVLNSVGFPKVEFRPLHPSDTYDVMVRNKRLDPHIAYLLFGPQDYAALAIKE